MAIPTDVRDAVVGAYYPRALAVSDGARSRAQAAYGIASAIAAALVAAGVFGNLDQRPGTVQALGILALVCWLAAAGLYLVAVSSPFMPASATQGSVESFVYAALDAAKIERDRIDRWLEAAALTSAIAALATVAAFVAALVITPDNDKAGTFAFTTKGKTAVTAACGATPARFTGSVAPADLQKEFVTVTLDEDVCGTKSVVVAIPRGQIEAVAFNR